MKNARGIKEVFGFRFLYLESSDQAKDRSVYSEI